MMRGFCGRCGARRGFAGLGQLLCRRRKNEIHTGRHGILPIGCHSGPPKLTSTPSARHHTKDPSPQAHVVAKSNSASIDASSRRIHMRRPRRTRLCQQELSPEIEPPTSRANTSNLKLLPGLLLHNNPHTTACRSFCKSETAYGCRAPATIFSSRIRPSTASPSNIGNWYRCGLRRIATGSSTKR